MAYIAIIEWQYHNIFMTVVGSVRRKSKEVFQKVIELRKKSFSYTEIKNETGVSKSTINNWLTFAGLTLSKEHLEISRKKYLQNNVIATQASKITRAKRKAKDIERFIQINKNNLKDPLFIIGLMLYESEGSKGENNNFSNSDFKMVVVYINFAEKYFEINRTKDMSFTLSIHETRYPDLNRIKRFWSKKLKIDQNKIKINWKHNLVSKRRINPNYVGQFNVRILNNTHVTSKLLAVSDIILNRYQKL